MVDLFILEKNKKIYKVFHSKPHKSDQFLVSTEDTYIVYKDFTHYSWSLLQEPELSEVEYDQAIFNFLVVLSPLNFHGKRVKDNFITHFETPELLPWHMKLENSSQTVSFDISESISGHTIACVKLKWVEEYHNESVLPHERSIFQIIKSLI
jgi:hypothetical protein